MFAAKIDLFKKDWLDVIFTNKNKNYGAYELRNTNALTTTRALFIGSIVFVSAFFAPKISELLGGLSSDDPIYKQTAVVVVAPPLKEEKIVIPPELQPVQPKTSTVKFAPPEVKADDKVFEEPPKLTDLVKADPGQKNIEGNPDADLVITMPLGEGPKQAKIVDDVTVYDYVSLEVMPSYPGGMDAFRKFLHDNIKYPPIAQETNFQGTVYVNFTVEKDGSLTNVGVDRKIGGGLDEEAIRVVKLGKKWTPGIQNGKEVRVRYNVPVKFSLM